VTRARLTVSEDDFCSGGFIYPYGCDEIEVEGDAVKIAPDGSSLVITKLKFDLVPCTGPAYSSTQDPDYTGDAFDFTAPFDKADTQGCPLKGVTNKLDGQRVVIKDIKLTCSDANEVFEGPGRDFFKRTEMLKVRAHLFAETVALR
jgi:hypothetical protein